jgi:hypothetical protein
MTAGLERAVAARQVFQEIAEFVLDRSTGSLDIVRGHAAAIVHVAGGRLTSAEPSTAPGIAQRLIGGGRISREAWHGLRGSDDGHGLAERLVRRGIVDPDALSAVTRSVLVDALLDLAVTEGEVVATPLDGDPDWLASPLRLDVEDVLREVSDRIADRAEIPSRATVALRRPTARRMVLTRAQLTVACHALTQPSDPDGAARPVEDGGADPMALPRRVPGSSPGLHDPVPAPLRLPAHSVLGRPFTEPDEGVLRHMLKALKGI